MARRLALISLEDHSDSSVTAAPTIHAFQATFDSVAKPSTQGAAKSQAPTRTLIHLMSSGRRLRIDAMATTKTTAPTSQAFTDAAVVVGSTIQGETNSHAANTRLSPVFHPVCIFSITYATSLRRVEDSAAAGDQDFLIARSKNRNRSSSGQGAESQDAAERRSADDGPPFGWVGLGPTANGSGSAAARPATTGGSTKLVSYYDSDGVLRIGVRRGDAVTPTGLPADDLGAQGSAAVSAISHVAAKDRAPLEAASLRLGPPIPRPGKVLCVGLNYREHAREAGMAIPTSPVLFSKFDNAITGPDVDVPVPAEVERLDYEAELVAVIGRRARRVSEAEALDYVLGFTAGNDLSARDLQSRTSQWLLGKTLDAFLPIGPELVTADEVPDPQDLAVRLWLNGELRQDSSTADMIFSVAEIISYVSTYIALEPGDVIATGTPQGVILGMDTPRWLQPGDTLEVRVGSMAPLVTRLVAED
jgi:2-keto-4-pentenoate hydratase/2-oxohepta-3-ene-1,7-dioic acid hydratase in catechol pathway